MRVVMTAVFLVCTALFAACGSDGDDPTATPTEIPDPNTLSDPQGALDAARALWAARGGDDYDMEFNWQCFCVIEYVQRVDLEVRGDAIDDGVVTDTGAALTDEQLAEYRTVSELFDFIQEGIDEDAHEIRVTYAPEGYPKEAWIDYQERVADEERGFFIHGLTVN